MEPARFEDLKVGDVVTYRNPRYGLLVVHRILEKRGDKFWSKGDNNGRMDLVYITRENYGARVFGIIYANEPSAQARRFAEMMAGR
jgi:signal peptidase I